MVAAPTPEDGSAEQADDTAAYFEELQERWPAERPSRRRAKRRYRRASGRRIVVRSELLPEPDTARMSRALLAAERELTRLQAEKEARAQAPDERPPEATDA